MGYRKAAGNVLNSYFFDNVSARVDNSIMWRSWTIGFLGIWIILIPLILNHGYTQTLLLIVTGIIIAALGFWKVVSEHVDGLDDD